MKLPPQTYLLGLLSVKIALSGCAIDPVTPVFDALTTQLIRTARDRAIIGRPMAARAQLLAFATEIPHKSLWKTDPRLEHVHAYLRNETDRIVEQARTLDLDAPQSLRTPHAETALELSLLYTMEPVAAVSQDDEPRIYVSVGYLLNLALATNLSKQESLLADSPECDDPSPLVLTSCLAWRALEQYTAGIEQRTSILEFQNAVLFSLAHEVTHAMFDRQAESKQERERRADAYAIVLSQALSPSVKRKVKLQAQLIRTGSIELSDPLDIATLSTRDGPDVALAVYRDYCFEGVCYDKGDAAHASINQRIATAAEYAGEIVDDLIASRSYPIIFADNLLRHLKDSLLGYSTGDDV